MAETTIDLLKNSSFETKMDALIAALTPPETTTPDIVLSATQPVNQAIGGYWYKIKIQ